MRATFIGLLLLCITSCVVAPTAQRPAPAAQRPPASLPVPTVQPTMPASLYSADEALRDALSGPLEYVGTGSWPGLRRMFACAFRNERVLVVNVYCSLTDRQALRLAIYSPTRGRVSVYAEGKNGITKQRRGDYFTFMVETEPVPPYASLAMTFEALRDFEDQRYNAYLPQCFGGQELGKPRHGCLTTLAPRTDEFMQQNRGFLEHASDEWYHLVYDMRVLAVHYGKEPL